MNQDKMAKFIYELRKEKNLNQETLANILFVSREAVSKWERGVSCPDPTVLLKLSEFFDVSVNELLYGERKNIDNENKINNVIVNLYDKQNKNRKIINFLVLGILLSLLLFFLYYFAVNYNSVAVYEISKDSFNLQISNGVIVSTNEKIYFNLGRVKSEKTIKNIELYYINNEMNKKTVMKTNNTNIAFYDLAGYEEYFKFKDKKNIISNLGIIVTFEDDEILDLKLNPRKFISNNNIFIKK